MLDEAVAASLPETVDLDWKKALPPAKGIAQTDFPKDVAAMANSGGGVIVFGVTEDQKAAAGRVDVGEVSETYERTLRSAAITGISPPVFNLGIHRLGESGNQALAVVVPGSLDGPHLIYRNELFGAPVRNDADTVWMREGQIEAMYRARFDERRNAHEALDSLYDEVASGRATGERAWMIGVARPRTTGPGRVRVSREDAAAHLGEASRRSLRYADRRGPHPFDDLDPHNPRPGLRRWVFLPRDLDDRSRWREAWATLHDDGSVTLVSAIGGHRISSGDYAAGSSIESARMERHVASLMALLRVASRRRGLGDHEVKIGVEWTGDAPLLIETVDQSGYRFDGTSIPLPHYTPVMTSIRNDVDENGFLAQVEEVARDVVNQGGITNLRAIEPLKREI